jgi:hypothetical protein
MLSNRVFAPQTPPIWPGRLSAFEINSVVTGKEQLHFSAQDHSQRQLRVKPADVTPM